jgi:hypothetical protein
VRLTCASIQQSQQSSGRRQNDQRASDHLEEAIRGLAPACSEEGMRDRAAAHLMQQQQQL